jgi:hypothetical protein
MAKKSAKTSSPKQTREQKQAERLKLAAKVAALRTGKDKLSFRAIEKKLAKELDLDPARPFGGFVAFNLFKLVKKNAKPAPKNPATKTAAKVPPYAVRKELREKTLAVGRKKATKTVETSEVPSVTA